MSEEVIYTSSINGQPPRNALSVVVKSKLKNQLGLYDVLATANFKKGIFRTSDPQVIKAMNEYEGYGLTYCRIEEAPQAIAAFKPGARFNTPPEFKPPPETVLREDLEKRGEKALGPEVEAPVAPGEDREQKPPMRRQVSNPVHVKTPGAEESPEKLLEEMNLGALRKLAKSLGLKIGVGKGIDKAHIVNAIKGAQSKPPS